jgi:predicted PolB exonuclease-like 3'-5' exonuclease
MIRTVSDTVLAFDAEWVPDPVAGRRLHALGDEISDRDVIARMWEAAGATEEKPRPYLKTIVCRIVSVSGVYRRRKADGAVDLDLRSLPADTGDPAQRSESTIVSSFLDEVGRELPQLVGFNSRAADIAIFVQRAVVNGVQAPAFFGHDTPPGAAPDYLGWRGEWSLDLMTLIGGAGRPRPSLQEAAVLSGIPGKLGIDGSQVVDLWLDGRLDEIVAYNETDAVTTYLLWLRCVHLAGHFSTTEYEIEQGRVERLLADRAAGGAKHLHRYLEEWHRLRR